MRKVGEYDSPCWYDDQVSFMPEQLDSPRRISHHSSALIASYNHQHHHHLYACKQELELQYSNMPADSFFQLPQLESPKVPYTYDRNTAASTAMQSSTLTQEDQQVQQQSSNNNNNQQNLSSLFSTNNNSEQAAIDQVTDWRVLDKFVASQLSHDQDASKETSTNYSNAAHHVFHVAEHMNLLANDQSKRPEIVQDYASTSTSASCPIDLWK